MLILCQSSYPVPLTVTDIRTNAGHKTDPNQAAEWVEVTRSKWNHSPLSLILVISSPKVSRWCLRRILSPMSFMSSQSIFTERTCRSEMFNFCQYYFIKDPWNSGAAGLGARQVFSGESELWRPSGLFIIPGLKCFQLTISILRAIFRTLSSMTPPLVWRGTRAGWSLPPMDVITASGWSTTGPSIPWWISFCQAQGPLSRPG